MASFACVVLVLVFVVVALSVEANFNGSVASMLKSVSLQSFKEEFNQGMFIIKPVQADYTKNENSVDEAKVAEEFQILVERSLPLENSNRDINSIKDFWKKRNALAGIEIEKLPGYNLTLNKKELKANKIILSKKYDEYDKSFSLTEKFPPSVRFSEVKGLIEQSDIFRIIRKIPKGANLYNLLITSLDIESMYELTFEDNLYFVFEEGLKIKFSKTPPGPSWRLLSQVRKSGITEYVDDLNKAIEESLVLKITDVENPSLNDSWKKYTEVLKIYNSLISYKPNFEEAFKTVLEILYEDNIMYAELAYHFPEVYDLNERIYQPVEILELCKVILNEFKESYKNFIGVRFIYVLEEVTVEKLRNARITVTDLWKAHPDLISGFSLVQTENSEKSLSYWIEELLKFPKEIKFFFDVGMTKSWGTNADFDLLDAITFNPAGIGLGFALAKHPGVLAQLREKKVPVHFSSIQAQALNIVRDLRDHSFNFLVASGVPVVIGNCGSTAYGSEGLSYDWYEAYLAMTPRFCDLRCLKQFALNSWLYSSLSNDEKKRSIREWLKMWDEFINYVVDNYS